MTQQTPEDVLAHFGVRGMRWGIRKGRGTARAASRSADSSAAKEALTKAKKSGVSSLSNQELQSLNSRLQLEQTYNKLTTKQKSTGKRVLEAVLGAGKTANDVLTFVNSPAGKMVRGEIEKKAKSAKS